MTKPIIIQEPVSLIPVHIPAVEKKYNAKFVGDFCLKAKGGGWINQPFAIFWQETPPVEGYSNYFALFVENDKVMITSGESAFSEPIVGIVADDGEVVFSRYRHDCRESKDGSVMMDGGRDYTRCSPATAKNLLVHIVIDGPNLKVVPFVERESENGKD